MDFSSLPNWPKKVMNSSSLFGSKTENGFYFLVPAGNLYIYYYCPNALSNSKCPDCCFLPLQDVSLRSNVELSLEVEAKFSFVLICFIYCLCPSLR